jgi:hypothetical protein
MKTFILYLLLNVFLITGITNLQAQTSNVCIGTDTLSSNYPFTTYWMDGRTDMLYLASELIAGGAAAGYFNGISFYVNLVDTLTMNGFNVKMMNTIDTSLSAFQYGWEIVYSGTYKVQSTGLQYIYFTQPFGWNGNDNIIIEICYNNNRWTYFSNVRSTVKPGKTYGAYQDLPSGDGCTEIILGNVQARRPNICLIFTPISGINSHNTVPAKYSLSQNYPNPFNPETRINYSIQKAGMVSLVVYDMLGRQVASLVNDYKTAGSYIVEFNASNLSSGVYYYKLISGEFTDTKKMIVIK